jgi:ElaB/YqjD/DUF883 family membrane-anchored ribosome-binding protein
MNTSERHLTETDTERPTQRQRIEIEETRADMGRTLERIEDRVSPTRIKERQTDRLRSRWSRTKDRVMGSNPESAGVRDRMGDASGRVSDTVQEAPDRLEHATRGNPIAAGLIAAGLGALAGSLLPTSEPERELGGKLRDELEEPVKSELQHAGEEVREELREDAQHSADAIKASAQDSAERTRAEAEGSARRVKDETRGVGQDEPTPARTRPAAPPQ